jgi:hypothetical protein
MRITAYIVELVMKLTLLKCHAANDKFKEDKTDLQKLARPPLLACIRFDQTTLLLDLDFIHFEVISSTFETTCESGPSHCLYLVTSRPWCGLG